VGSWIASITAAPAGSRKLTGLMWSLLAAVALDLGGVAALYFLPVAAHPSAVSIVQVGLGCVAGLFAAMVGGNAAEHRHAKDKGAQDAGR